MNLFTTMQLVDNINKPGGAVYYDTKTQDVNYTPYPLLSITGNNMYETRLFGLKTNNHEKKEGSKINKKKICPTTKHTREFKPVPEEERCCENTLEGTQCKLKKCENSEMCFIHYKKYNKKEPVIEQNIEKPIRSSSKNWFSKKWGCSLKWW